MRVDSLDQLGQLHPANIAFISVLRLKLRAVDGQQPRAKEMQFAAQQIELAQHAFEALGVILAEVRYGFEIWALLAQ